jgi:hypothetical protein
MKLRQTLKDMLDSSATSLFVGIAINPKEDGENDFLTI